MVNKRATDPERADDGLRPRRKQKLSDDQLRRKRASDREAQRVSREKTRCHVAHLESIIEALQAGQDDRVHLLIEQVSQQKTELSRLKNALNSIFKIAEVSRQTTDSLPVHRSRSNSTQEHNAGDLLDSRAEKVAAPLASQFRSNLESGQQAQPPVLTAGVTELTARAPTDTELEYPISIAQLASSIIKRKDLDGRYWFLAGTLLSHLRKTRGEYPLSTASDEDIVIRAIFEGWSAVIERYPLDRGFQWLKELDENIYFSGTAEGRLVHLRNSRLQFLHQMQPDAGWNHALPEFFAPGPLQQNMEHDPLIEYFPWPGFRERVLFSPRRYATDQFMGALAQNARFEWPYDPHDVFIKDPVSGLYSYSATFQQKVMDFSCYTVKESFFDCFPELRQDIPQYGVPAVVRSVCLTDESGSPDTARHEHSFP
ncbi:uncharacterized protein AB675_1292 [Cyphellophora attinorum]|uniref:BZIP domain-containing protein n=1 Tax=Cyphellophora attinorum TaxID=1664694 RepID=A0A0N1GYI3_9EURO|nr:uncharacterized protein AB675_1292 [Phialophora attinorum]KPI35742.1 hypothetical protein AB675_1292 [Phialophora attinorum]